MKEKKNNYISEQNRKSIPIQTLTHVFFSIYIDLKKVNVQNIRSTHFKINLSAAQYYSLKLQSVR